MLHEALRKIERCFEGLLRVFQGRFKGLKRSFKVISRMCQGCFMKVSRRWKFQGCFMIFKGVPRVFQRCFKEVSRNLLGCFKKFHVAWPSSQLPEQKEGLFTVLDSFNHPPRVIGRGGTKKAPICSCLEQDLEILQVTIF